MLANSASAKDLKCPVLLEPALSEQEKEVVRQHPIFAYAQKLDYGKDITFNSAFFNAPKVSNLYKGEVKQMQFVAKYLHYLFPRALYSSKDSTFIEQEIKAYKKKNKKLVHLTLADVGESGGGDENRDFILQNGLMLPMHRVKPANSQPLTLDRHLLRQALGIEPNKKVLHTYIRSLGTFLDVTSRQKVHADETRLFFEALRQGYNADIVIISFGNKEKRAWGAESTYTAATRAPHIFKLSKLKASDLQNATGKVVILNDTVGRMIELHAVSDIAVVAGPVNFFEPLSVQTPTLLFYRSDALGRNNHEFGYYDRSIYDEQITLALQSGGVEVARTFEDASKALHKLKQIRREKIVDISHHAQKAFLDALLLHLQYSVERYREADYIRAGLSIAY